MSRPADPLNAARPTPGGQAAEGGVAANGQLCGVRSCRKTIHSSCGGFLTIRALRSNRACQPLILHALISLTMSTLRLRHGAFRRVGLALRVPEEYSATRPFGAGIPVRIP